MILEEQGNKIQFLISSYSNKEDVLKLGEFAIKASK